MKKLFCLVMVFAGCLFGGASTAGAVEDGEFLAGLDVLSHGLFRVAASPSGSPGTLGTKYFNLEFQTHILVSDSWYLSPEILWMPNFLLPTESAGGSAKTSFLILALPLTYKIDEDFDAGGGLAFINYQIAGAGGTEQLSNGTGTSTFAVPGSTVTARTIGLQVGAGYSYKPVRVSIDIMTEGLLSSSKRTLSVLLGFTYNAFNF